MYSNTVIKSVFIAVLALVAVPVSVLSQANLKLAVFQYETRSDLDILFDHTTRVIDFLEGSEIENPVLLALVTEDQGQMIHKLGLRPEILDEEADINRYVYLYNRNPGQAPSLAVYGDVYAITPHHTIVKISPGASLSEPDISSGFRIIPIATEVVKPAMQTKTTQNLATGSIVTDDFQDAGGMQYLPVILVVLFVAILLSAVYVWKRRNTNTTT